MKNRLTSIAIVCLVVIAGFFGFISFESGVVSAGNVWYVGSGPGNHSTTIQGGINLASDGDTVFVYSGTYIENVGVDKMINLIGEERDATIIDGGGVLSVVYISANWVNITGFTITNGGKGIDIQGSSNKTISNNSVSNCVRGIVAQDSLNNIIANNSISNNDVGIYVRDSSDIKITDNNFVNDGIVISGSELKHFNSHTIPDNNMVNGKPLYYYKDTSGISIDSIPVGELILANCTDFIAKNMQIDNTDMGIEVAYSTNTLIANNNISSIYWAGIWLQESSNNTITNNDLSSIYGDIYGSGIFLHESTNNNIIINNNVSSAKWGFGIRSTNNTITNNKVWDNKFGITFGSSSSNNIAKGNNIFNNMYGLSIYWTSDNEITWNNFSNNDYGIFFQSASNNNIISNNISNGENGLYFVESSNGNVITGNTISSNNNGSYLEESSNNIIANNNISNNYNGIYSWMSTNNITNNDISDNLYGIYLATVVANKYNIIRNNNISNNDYGIYINWTFDNLIYHNNFIDNTNQAYDNTNNRNQWDNGYPSGGNYWSDFDESSEGAHDDFNGADQLTPGSDGIVDNGSIAGGGKNPYVIDADSQDNYPLINPVDTSPPTITNLQPPDGSTTNDNTPTISADYSDPSGINVSSVVLKVDGIDVTSSATVTASGVSYIPGMALSDGIHTVYIEVKDNFDNIGTAMWTFTVDTTPPTIINLQPPDASITNNSTPLIGANYYDLSGINVGSVVLVVDGINVTLFSMVTTSGVSYIPATALPEGFHTVYLEVRDNYNNLATATWTFTVDTIPPTITNLQPPDTSTTNDNTPTISADYSDPSGIDLSSVLLKVDGIDITPYAIVTASGVSYIPPVALPDAVHTVYVEVRDNAGNLATAMWSFTVEATPPIITNLQPPDSSTTNDNTTIISADYTDSSGINVSTILLEVDGIDVTSFATVTASGVSCIPGTALPEGVHTVYLEVKDIYGNLATAMWNFTVDTSPPIITNLQPPDASITNNSTSIIAADYNDVSGINMSSVLLKVDGIDVTLSAVVTAINVTYIPGLTLSDDMHTVYLEVRDIHGNLATVSWNFTVDTLPPIITNLQPPDVSRTNDNTSMISADFSDPSGINMSSIMLEVDGIDVTPSATVTAGNVSYIPGTALPDGIRTVYLEVRDNVGNLATASWSFTVDTTSPTITNLQPTDASTVNNSTPTINADYSDLSGINMSSVVLKVDGLDVTPFATVTASSITYISTPLTDNVHTVYLEVRDNVGNLATATWSFTVDTTSPTITNLLPPDASTTNDNTPIISADYSDSSGINVSSVMLEVDGVDVTSSAIVTANSVSYTPGTAMIDGTYTVYLEVRDIYGNLATTSWSFDVEATPPTISNLQPPDGSTTNDNTPTISADYNDISGIDVGSVTFTVDGADVTSLASVAASGVSYTPGTELVDGSHTVYLEVEDIYGNFAIKSWSFEVEATSPILSNLQPPDGSTSNDYAPTISAGYSDLSGINVGSVVLKVDDTDVTASAIVTASGVTYTPGTALSDGTHTVYLEVRDNYGNLATVLWSFNVDYPPTIEAWEPGGSPGQTYTQGDMITITWIANDGDPLPANPINITYRDPISGWIIIAKNEPNDGSYNWDTSTVLPGTYWLNLSVYDSFGQTIFDEGNYSFVINIPVTYPPEIEDVKAEPDPQTVNKEVTISAAVTDPDTDLNDLTVRVNITKPNGISLGNFTMTYNSTSGRYIYTTNYYLKGTYIFVIWANDEDGNWADEEGVFLMEPREKERVYNWKPIIALIFTIILLILGILISFKRPLKFKGELEKDRWYTFLAFVLPFAVAESATGLISLFTGFLTVPPILGVGMVVDLTILIAGLISSVVIFRKAR